MTARPRSRRMFLVTILREREWKILKKYLPPTLFIETNLPSTKIYDPTSREIINEDAPLALAVYLPGKPLFRVGGSTGALIPIKRFASSQTYYAIVTGRWHNINIDYYITKRLRPPPGFMNKLPEEYRYFISQILNNNIVEVHTLDEVKPAKFFNYINGQQCFHWFSWYDGSMFSLIYDPPQQIEPALRRAFNESRLILKMVRRYSNSFGRFTTILFDLNPLTEYRDYENKLISVLDYAGVRSIGFYQANVLKLLYAIDFRQSLYRCKVQTNAALHRVLMNRCMNMDMCVPSLGFRPLRIEILDGVKILGVALNNIVTPMTLGYKIDATKLIEIRLNEHYINDFINQVLERITEINLPSFNELCELSNLNNIYIKLTINQAIVDILRYFLTNDLAIRAGLANVRLKIEPLVNAMIAYVDIYGRDKISDIIHSKECDEIVETILSELLRFIDSLSRNNPRALVVKYFLYGERVVIPRNINLDDIRGTLRQFIYERLKELLCDSGLSTDTCDWRCKILKSVLLHTLNHHIISLLSTRSRIPVDYLSEMYDFAEPYSYIFESVSGGIGAIDTVVKYWIEHLPEEVLEDFVMKFGSCLSGSPEDLVYFAIASSCGDTIQGSPSEAIVNTIGRLNIIYTPEEREEAIKLYNALLSEVERLASLARTVRAHVDAWSLLREAIKARYECEKEFKRFCTTDEITLHMFKNLHRYPLIKKLLIALTIKYLEAKDERRRNLSNIYNISNIMRLAEEFIEDLYRVVIGVNTRLDITNEEIRFVIIDIIRVLKSALIKLYLKGCDNACSLCYLNTRSCRFNASWIQKRTLNRRLAKLYATHVVQRLTRRDRDPLVDIRGLIGKIILNGTDKYLYV